LRKACAGAPPRSTIGQERRRDSAAGSRGNLLRCPGKVEPLRGRAVPDREAGIALLPAMGQGRPMHEILFWAVCALIAFCLLGAFACAALGRWRDFRILYVPAWALVAAAWIVAIAVPAGGHATASGDFALRMILVSFAGAIAAAVTGLLALALWAWRERR
jgi:hypothetical protein